MNRRALFLVLLLLLAFATGAYFLYFRESPSSPERPAVAEAPTPLETPTLAPAVPEPVQERPAQEKPAPAGGQPLATLAGFQRDVRARRAAGLTWDAARLKMPFFENDAVRTLNEASASISFGPDDRVEVGQDSLVIITPRRGQEADGEIS